jgi:hypothetical protein
MSRTGTMSAERQNEYDGIDHRQSTGADGGASMQSGKTEVSNDPEQTGQVGTKAVDVPPDGGYGWVCVACVFLINAHTWGVNSVCIPSPTSHLRIC